jgi:hypothetical protein
MTGITRSACDPYGLYSAASGTRNEALNFARKKAEDVGEKAAAVGVASPRRGSRRVGIAHRKQEEEVNRRAKQYQTREASESLVPNTNLSTEYKSVYIQSGS